LTSGSKIAMSFLVGVRQRTIPNPYHIESHVFFETQPDASSCQLVLCELHPSRTL
jgi:hypothetical protein